MTWFKAPESRGYGQQAAFSRAAAERYEAFLGSYIAT
jgi:hypothetical protein